MAAIVLVGIFVATQICETFLKPVRRNICKADLHSDKRNDRKLLTRKFARVTNPQKPSPGLSISMNNLEIKTSIPQPAPDKVLKRFRSALAPHIARSTLFEFPVAPLDRLDLPQWTIALIGEDATLSDGYGYGANETLARVGAWGETLEWFFAREHLRKTTRRRATYNELRNQGAPAINPVTLNLAAGSTYTPDQSLVWVEARRYESGEATLVPIEFAAPRYADIATHAALSPRESELIGVPITNGLGAGLTLEHAIAQGALELLQRDGNSVNYRALDRGIRIELDDVRDPETLKLLDYLDREGIEVIVKLAATDFGITNLYVVGYDRDPNRAMHQIALSACGEAAHPDRERALAKALREFTSSRARKHFMHGSLDTIRRFTPPDYLEAFRPETLRDEDDHALRGMSGWLKMKRAAFLEMLRERVLHVASAVRFSELPTTDATEFHDAGALLKFLVHRFASEGYEVFYVDFSDPESGVHVVKTIIPGFEVETMTYERIGRRNLQKLLQRGSPIVGTAATLSPHGAKRILLTERDERIIGGAAWFSSAARESEIGNLYALYREPGRHVIAFAEELNTQTAARS